jgi:hypothetical protein
MSLRHRPLATLSLAVLLAAVSLQGQAKVQSKTCDDPIPTDCTTVKSLGEDKGCACFVCNPDGPNRRVICTSKEADKKTLYRMSGKI